MFDCWLLMFLVKLLVREKSIHINDRIITFPLNHFQSFNDALFRHNGQRTQYRSYLILETQMIVCTPNISLVWRIFRKNFFILLYNFLLVTNLDGHWLIEVYLKSWESHWDSIKGGFREQMGDLNGSLLYIWLSSWELMHVWDVIP